MDVVLLFCLFYVTSESERRKAAGGGEAIPGVPVNRPTAGRFQQVSRRRPMGALLSGPGTVDPVRPVPVQHFFHIISCSQKDKKTETLKRFCFLFFLQIMGS